MSVETRSIFDATHPVVRFLLGHHRRDIQVFKKQSEHPEVFQRQRFAKILNLSSHSEFGEAFGIHKLKNIEDIRSLPIRNYDDFEPWIQRISNGEKNILSSEAVLGLMETSGTTGKAKRIPVTKSWKVGIQQAQRLWILRLLCAHPQLVNTKSFNIVSSANERLSLGGIPIGANTGRMRDAQPWWAKGSFVLPKAIEKIKDPSVKAYVSLRFALQEPIGILVTANPSMLLRYARLLKQWRGELAQDLKDATLSHGPASALESQTRAELQSFLRPASLPFGSSMAEVWPLQAVACWKGGPAAYFVDRLSEAIGAPLPIHEVGITASEGFFSLALHSEYAGGLFWSAGHVVEFIDANENAFFCWELNKGEQYRLVITTENGLWRYDLNDTVEVVDMYNGLPALRFVGKSGRFLNAVGEKVSEAQISQLFQVSSRNQNLKISGFTGRVHWAEIPHLIIAIEPLSELPMDFAQTLEQNLQNINIEYASKRQSDRLNPLQIECLPKGTYQRYREARISDGAPDGQIKDFILAPDEQAWNKFLTLVGRV